MKSRLARKLTKTPFDRLAPRWQQVVYRGGKTRD